MKTCAPAREGLFCSSVPPPPRFGSVCIPPPPPPKSRARAPVKEAPCLERPRQRLRLPHLPRVLALPSAPLLSGTLHDPKVSEDQPSAGRRRCGGHGGAGQGGRVAFVDVNVDLRGDRRTEGLSEALVAFVHSRVLLGSACLQGMEVPSPSSGTDAPDRKCAGDRALPHGGKLREENTGLYCFFFL